MDNLKQRTVNGVAWKLSQTLATKGLTFFFAMFMTRLLSPEDYGLIGMLSVFMMISTAFIDCGFGQALIRKQKSTYEDNCTVFYFNLLSSSLCYILLFILSPFVAEFYNMPILKDLLRIYGLSLIIGALYSIQVILYSKSLDFKTPTLVGLISNIFSGFIGIFMAYNEFGVWSLVGQQISYGIIQALIFFNISKWKPMFVFSLTSFKEMFAFGSKLLGANLLDVVYNQISPIFIGKYYSASKLGLFSKSEQLASFPCNTVYSTLSSVTMPVLSKIQEDRIRLSSSYRKFICLTSYVLFPFMIMLSIFSKDFLVTFFGNKWSGASIYLSIMCIPWMLVPLHNLNINLLAVKGRSDLILRLGFIVKGVGFSILCITIPISVTAVCIGYTITTYSCYFVNTYYTAKFIDYPLKRQLADIIKPAIISIVVGIIAYIISSFFIVSMIRLFIGFIVGICLYAIVTYLLKFNEISEIKNIIINMRLKK